jgi:hypothetical protein
MKIHELKKRLNQKRPTANISLEIPVDVVEDLKNVALRLGFSNFQSLMRAYIGQGLRIDLERLENSEISEFIESLRRLGVEENVIVTALSDLKRAA